MCVSYSEYRLLVRIQPTTAFQCDCGPLYGRPTDMNEWNTQEFTDINFKITQKRLSNFDFSNPQKLWLFKPNAWKIRHEWNYKQCIKKLFPIILNISQHRRIHSPQKKKQGVYMTHARAVTTVGVNTLSLRMLCVLAFSLSLRIFFVTNSIISYL
jgi:hypothetical protein